MSAACGGGGLANGRGSRGNGSAQVTADLANQRDAGRVRCGAPGGTICTVTPSDGDLDWMPESAAGLWARVTGTVPRPVVLSSAYPPEECLRRLAIVTTYRGPTSWYLDPQTVGRPEPQLRGEVGRSRIFVSRWADAYGRDSFVPWLDARLESAVGGGSTLAGTIGLHPGAGALFAVFAGVAGLMAAIVLAVGISLLDAGHPIGLAPAVLAPLAPLVLLAGLRAASLRLPERKAGALVREIREILGPAGASAGSSADSGA